MARTKSNIRSRRRRFVPGGVKTGSSDEEEEQEESEENEEESEEEDVESDEDNDTSDNDDEMIEPYGSLFHEFSPVKRNRLYFLMFCIHMCYALEYYACAMVLSFAFLLVKPFTWQSLCSIRYGVITVLIAMYLIRQETELLATYEKVLIGFREAYEEALPGEAVKVPNHVASTDVFENFFHDTNRSMTSTEASDAESLKQLLKFGKTVFKKFIYIIKGLYYPMPVIWSVLMYIVRSLIIHSLMLIFVGGDKFDSVLRMIRDFWFFLILIIKYLYFLESTAIIGGYASALIFAKSTKLKSK